MARFFPVVLALLATPALADSTITFRGPGNGMEAPHAFVDGTNVGRVRAGQTGLTVSATPGTHAIRIAHDAGGVITWCHGTVDVPADGQATVALGKPSSASLTCKGTSPDADAQSGLVAFQLTRGLDAWLSIDAGRPVMLPRHAFLLKLSPGAHDVVLYEDVMEDVVIARSTVVTPAQGIQRVRCSLGGCSGLRTQPDPVARSGL